MAEFDAGRARFVQDPENFKASAAKRLHGQETLIRIGMRGHADNRLKRLTGTQLQIGTMTQRPIERGRQAGQEMRDADLATLQAGAKIDQRARARLIKKPLDRSNHYPILVGLRFPGIPAIPDLPIVAAA